MEDEDVPARSPRDGNRYAVKKAVQASDEAHTLNGEQVSSREATFQASDSADSVHIKSGVGSALNKQCAEL